MKETMRNAPAKDRTEPNIASGIPTTTVTTTTTDNSSSYFDSFSEIISDGEERRSYYETVAIEREEDDAKTISSCNHKVLEEGQEEENENITPLPKLQLFIIAIVLISEPLTCGVLFPFIYFMLKDFHLSDDEKEIGAYAGWITSMFFVAQFCTAILWGKVSDRYGRRPVLLMGLLGNTISSCLFGMSKSLAWAVASRTLCGIMNGNVGAARSMVNEITDTTNKAKAFSLFGFCWGLGMIGPVIGGYLVNPVDHFPTLFGTSDFFKTYPYSLPCFAAATASMFGFCIGFFFLKESNPTVIAQQQQRRVIECTQEEVDESTSLLVKSKAQLTNLDTSAADMTKEAGSLRDVPKTSILVISGYFVYAIHSMVFDEVLPLYFTAPKYAGGLGINTQEFAKILAFFGLVQIVSQVFVYPRLTKYYDILFLARWAFVAIVPVYMLLPELTTVQNWSSRIHFPSFTSTDNGSVENGQPLALVVSYTILLTIRWISAAATFTGFNLMVNMSAPSEISGIVNGLNMAVTALARAFGPTFGGTIWSYSLQEGNKYPFDHHLIYYLISAMAAFNLVHSIFIPQSVALGGKKRKTS